MFKHISYVDKFLNHNLTRYSIIIHQYVLYFHLSNPLISLNNPLLFIYLVQHLYQVHLTYYQLLSINY